MTSPSIDIDHVFKLRLVVARFGEMDGARWWNTGGQLGKFGASVLRRGFPRTYRFAQARSVFAVAAQRCADVFDPPDSVTLWRLPEGLEEVLEARWEHWLDRAADWEPFFQKIESPLGADLASTLHTFDLVSEADLDACRKLRRSAEGRAVALPGAFSSDRPGVALLALGFSLGEPEKLAVPHIKRVAA